MLRSLPLLVLAALLTSFFSCKKNPLKLPTIVKGTVMDSRTGEPIAGALVEFWVYIQKDQFPGYQQTTVAVQTKNDGSFEYTLRADANEISSYSVTAGGYVKKNINYGTYAIKLGETNELSIPLIRYDAAIRLHIINETEVDGAVYIVISNPTKLAEARTSWGVIKFSPLIIGQGQQQNYVYPTIANEYTTFYWGSSSFSPHNTAPLSDSLYFNIGDTLDYTIHF